MLRVLGFLFVSLFCAQSAWADWSINSECSPRFCRLQDSNTNLIWSRSSGVAMQRLSAASACAQSGMRLPSPAEYETAVANGLARAHLTYPSFGSPQGFFWANEPGKYVSFLDGTAKHYSGTGYEFLTFKCVLDNGSNPPPPPPPPPGNDDGTSSTLFLLQMTSIERAALNCVQNTRSPQWAQASQVWQLCQNAVQTVSNAAPGRSYTMAEQQSYARTLRVIYNNIRAVVNQPFLRYLDDQIRAYVVPVGEALAELEKLTGMPSSGGGGGGDDRLQNPGMPAVSQSIASIQNSLNSLGQNVNTQGNFPNMDLPNLNIDWANGKPKVVLTTPADYQTQKNIQKQREAGAPAPAPQPMMGWNKTVKSNWGLGNNLLGLNLALDLNANYNGASRSSALMNATLFGARANIVTAEVSSTPQPQEMLNVRGTLRVLNNTYSLINENLRTGETRQLPREQFFYQEFYHQRYNFAIGPVPVTVVGSLVGAAGRDDSYWRWSAGGRVKGASISVNPYAGLDVQVKGGPGLDPELVGAYGKATLIEGAINGSTDVGTSGHGPWACATIKLKNLNMLGGEFGAYARWEVVRVEEVKTFIEGVCRGGWIGQQICSAGKQVIEMVEKVTTFEHKQKLVGWSPIRLAADHNWFNDCGR